MGKRSRHRRRSLPVRLPRFAATRATGVLPAGKTPVAHGTRSTTPNTRVANDDASCFLTPVRVFQGRCVEFCEPRVPAMENETDKS
jgi:hypothetical protein